MSRVARIHRPWSTRLLWLLGAALVVRVLQTAFFAFALRSDGSGLVWSPAAAAVPAVLVGLIVWVAVARRAADQERGGALRVAAVVSVVVEGVVLALWLRLVWAVLQEGLAPEAPAVAGAVLVLVGVVVAGLHALAMVAGARTFARTRA